MSLITFNFYSEGSSFPEVSLLEKSLPTIVGILIGFALNRIYEVFRERRLIKHSGEEFINEVQLYAEPFEKQINSLQTAIAQLGDENLRTFILEANIPLDTDRFIAINRLNIYKFFQKRFKKNSKESRKVVNKLFGILKLCTVETESMKSHFANYNEKRAEDMLRFNNALNGLLGAFGDMVLKMEKDQTDPKTDNFYLAIKPYFDSFDDVNLMTPYEIIPSFFEPLVYISAQYRLDERSDSFSEQLREGFAAVRDLRSLRANLIFQLEHIKNTLSKQKVEFDKILAMKELVLN